MDQSFCILATVVGCAAVSADLFVGILQTTVFPEKNFPPCRADRQLYRRFSRQASVPGVSVISLFAIFVHCGGKACLGIPYSAPDGKQSGSDDPF